MPRTIGQAEALEQAGVTFDHVLSIEISDAEIEERMEGRRSLPTCGATLPHCGQAPQAGGRVRHLRRPLMQRDDDKPETVQHRLEVYHSETEPLKATMRPRGS